MDPELLARGVVLGFTIAAAVGPISLLVIRRTLAEGEIVGLASGLGVATADATYGAIAAFGLGAITNVLVGGGRVLGLVGGAFLLWLAWRTARAEPTEPASTPARRGGLAGAYLSILGLTLTNPMTILSFAAIFGGLGLGSPDAVSTAENARMANPRGSPEGTFRHPHRFAGHRNPPRAFSRPEARLARRLISADLAGRAVGR